MRNVCSLRLSAQCLWLSPIGAVLAFSKASKVPPTTSRLQFRKVCVQGAPAWDCRRCTVLLVLLVATSAVVADAEVCSQTCPHCPALLDTDGSVQLSSVAGRLASSAKLPTAMKCPHARCSAGINASLRVHRLHRVRMPYCHRGAIAHGGALPQRAQDAALST